MQVQCDDGKLYENPVFGGDGWMVRCLDSGADYVAYKEGTDFPECFGANEPTRPWGRVQFTEGTRKPVYACNGCAVSIQANPPVELMLTHQGVSDPPTVKPKEKKVEAKSKSTWVL